MTVADRLRDLGPRLLAGFVFLSAAGLVFVLTSLPTATLVDSRVQPWEAARLETVTIGLDPKDLGPDNPVISLTGPVGKDLSVWFGKARYGDATRVDLTALGLAETLAIPPRGWVTHEGGSGRAGVEISLTPTSRAQPRLSARPTGHDGSADLVLIAHDAEMVVRLEASLDPAAPDPEIVGPDKTVPLRMTGDGGFPLVIVVPAEAPVTIRLPEESLSGAEFRMGRIADEGQAAAFTATALRIDSSRGGERLAACGAPRGAIAWTSRRVAIDRCKPVLGLVDLDVTGRGLSLEVNGRGYLAVDGEAKALPLQKVTENPVLSLALGGAYTALGGWAWRMIMRKRAAPPKRASGRSGDRRRGKKGSPQTPAKPG